MELIARGRAADVFDLGDGRVLRRYRDGGDAALEARAMLHLEERGYPVPHVYDAEGPDLVVERVDGGTLFDEMVHEPAQYRRYGRLLGELHERLHRLPAPPWLADDTEGLVVIHRDLHPQNVILSVRGPVVIDWTDVTAGKASVDAAVTVLLTLGSDLDVDPAVAEHVEPFRALFVDAFLETCGTDPREGLTEAIEYRLGTPNNTQKETAWLTEDGPRCLDAFYLEPRELQSREL
ncbi:phosphotransferase [Humibacter sp.]|jgi:Ser/Thr protein kinase RdoA (MazF antagonist)|uniref:phosphotransferase n=1 Tax=Humibacter sp. TaxID=1940291 RepID=UPI002B5AE0AC|nr:phosphotransferase [Humibacter sp.]HVX07188.1 phosphotransferase [Humibacter sp.]